MTHPPSHASSEHAPTPADDSRELILGTAGHIDHGKTSLIRALTGTDTDRLPEEKQRGMTIELGFAELSLPGVHFGIVDVPGHERFVKTMVAGATGVDLAMLVVAADDSVMPQTIEHLEILHLLGVERAVVAVTKIDTVDEEMVELVVAEVEELLDGTALAGSAIVPVSSVTEAGLDTLREKLAALARELALGPVEPPFRMNVDRVFTVQGRGTVVTGSVWRGQVAVGDSLAIHPGEATCRVRGLQAHGTGREHLLRGQRAALNLSGIDREALSRGAQLATPGYLREGHLLDVELRLLPANTRPMKSASTVRLGIGTSEVPVRVVLLEGDMLLPGESGYAQLRSGTPIHATHGERFILRDENAARTLGGGVVLRPRGRRRRRLDRDAERQALQRLQAGEPADRLTEVLRFAGFHRPTELELAAEGGFELAELPALFEQLREDGRWVKIPGTEVFVVPASLEELITRLTGWLERYHRKNPDVPGRSADAVLGWLERMTEKNLARPIFDQLLADQTIKRVGRFACLAEFAPKLSPADEKRLTEMVEAIRAGRFQPPAPAETPAGQSLDRKRLARLLIMAVALGELVEVGNDIYLHQDLEFELREAVASLIQMEGGVTVAQAREALGTTRKFAVPFMEYLDRIEFTRRVGDKRHLYKAGK
jgi:selenocysteine-specific elongation factor